MRYFWRNRKSEVPAPILTILTWSMQGVPPASLAEFTLSGANDLDWYDGAELG